MDSSLASEFIKASHFSNGRDGRKIEMITLHHMASVLTARGCGNIFQGNRQASAHYGVGYDGSVAQYVEEKNTAWANANWDSNCKAVTIELSNDSTGGEWHVGDTTLQKGIELIADIAKRNGLGQLVKGKNLTWHRMYCATTCPGEYILSRLDYIIEKANELIGGSTPQPTPQPATGLVAGIQRTLNARYGFSIVVDNIAGNQTKTALIKALQIELNNQYHKGIVVDGIFGNQTKNACITVRKGAKGNITWLMQARLTCLGYTGNGTDGYFGDKTLNDVKNFQKAKGIVVDGIVGQQTWGKLFN